MKQNNIEKILRENPIVPVVTFNSKEEVDEVVQKLLSQNIKCIEVTLRTDCAFDCIAYAKEKYGEQILVGMGTVTNVNHVYKAQELQADFMVSPGISRTQSSAFERSSIPFIPGVSTPSEIIKAVNLGYEVLKFFPANLFGGIGALKSYGQVFPQVKFCPTGGVSVENYEEYLALDNVIAVGGSWLTK